MRDIHMELVDKYFKDNLVIEQEIHYGKQYVFRFENSYGLSVIEEEVGEGPKYNIAVIKFDIGDNEYDIDYSTGIANKDVLTNKEEVILHLLCLVKQL
jgi:hypothetical protein